MISFDQLPHWDCSLPSTLLEEQSSKTELHSLEPIPKSQHPAKGGTVRPPTSGYVNNTIS